MGKSIELAWAAGFFDGEGSTFLLGGKYIRVSVGQRHDSYVIERFAKAVGATTKVHYSPRYDRYMFRATGLAAVKVLQLLWPYLGPVKKAQARQTLDKTKFVAGLLPF